MARLLSSLKIWKGPRIMLSAKMTQDRHNLDIWKLKGKKAVYSEYAHGSTQHSGTNILYYFLKLEIQLFPGPGMVMYTFNLRYSGG